VFREVGSGKLVQNLRVSDAKGLLEYNGVGIDRKGFATIRGKGCGVGGDGVEDRQHSPAVVEALVKVGWAIAALEAGVKRAHLIAPNDGALLQELYTRDGSGTLISRDLYEGIRPGNFNDVAGIFDLIEPLVKAGTLVPRPKTVLEKDADSYFVYTRDNLIVACAQLKLFEEGGGEEGAGVQPPQAGGPLRRHRGREEGGEATQQAPRAHTQLHSALHAQVPSGTRASLQPVRIFSFHRRNELRADGELQPRLLPVWEVR